MDFHCEKTLTGILYVLGTAGAIYGKEATIWDVAKEKSPTKA